jgi:glycosyltransferase involved in cell wall biosynthesis
VTALISRLRRRYHIRRKNSRINANLHRFIHEHAHIELPPREAVFVPEVLIPCFNHGSYLESALASIPGDVAVTIIDDASTDDTPRIIASLASRHSFKLLRNKQNLLQNGSLNRAIEESDHNLFVVLNADDCLLPFSIDTVRRVLTAFPSVRMVGGGSIIFSGEPTREFLKALPATLGYCPTPRIFNRDTARSYHHLNDINMSMSGSAFLRSAWSAAGGYLDFRERVCSYDDRDFQMRVSCLFDVAVLDEPLCLYRVTSSLGRAEFVR